MLKYAIYHYTIHFWIGVICIMKQICVNTENLEYAAFKVYIVILLYYMKIHKILYSDDIYQYDQNIVPSSK